MNRLRAVFPALIAVLPLSAHSAEISRIASSFEDDHPFGMFIDVGFERTQRQELITHELHENGAVVDKPELRYLGIDTRLKLDAHIGLWKDLEFHYGLPIVFQQDDYYSPPGGTLASDSTLAAMSTNNCILANGQLVDPNCPSSGVGSKAIVSFPKGGSAASYRGGLGNMTFGLAYALFNQLKDDTKPTWIVGIDYEAPTSGLRDPTADLSQSTTQPRGKIGDRVHKYTFFTTFSRRIGPVDPYFQVHYTVPYRGPGWYSNCDASLTNMANMSHPENCGTKDWTRDDTGIQIPQTAGVVFGSEFYLFNDSGKHQKVSLDLRTLADYVGPGRYYNELTPIFGKLLYTGDYLQIGGSAGINAYASDYIRLQASATFLYVTSHSLTDEPVGKDLDKDGTVGIATQPGEVNPNFDFRADAPSRQFRASHVAVFRVNVTASFNF